MMSQAKDWVTRQGNEVEGDELKNVQVRRAQPIDHRDDAKSKSLGSTSDIKCTLCSLLLMEEGEYALGLKTCQEAGEK
jgi:hypothetical protein